MKRRTVLKMASAAALGLPAFPFGRAASAGKKLRILYFTRSQGFEHSVVKRAGAGPSHSETVLSELGRTFNFEMESTKDGRVFDGDLDQYDVIAFYTTGDLTQPAADGSPPMTAAGKQKLLQAIANGKGFLGAHSATDTFHSKGPQDQNQTEVDPYIAMIGGEFVTHGEQQEASLLLVAPKFPIIANLGVAEGLPFTEEWYTFKNFAKDLHVILVQETQYMKGDAYRRPDFPASWARLHGKGRVFYTSLGHREEVWSDPFFQAVLHGALEWTGGRADYDVPPNIDTITPEASRLKT
jgi:type 1 glutamine amidotransferase